MKKIWLVGLLWLLPALGQAAALSSVSAITNADGSLTFFFTAGPTCPDSECTLTSSSPPNQIVIGATSSYTCGVSSNANAPISLGGFDWEITASASQLAGCSGVLTQGATVHYKLFIANDFGDSFTDSDHTFTYSIPTPTFTPTVTPTSTITLTSTLTKTSTVTPTSTVTSTSTGTSTFTRTATITSTFTRTATITQSATRPFTASPTSTATPTSTFTRIPTPPITAPTKLQVIATSWSQGAVYLRWSKGIGSSPLTTNIYRGTTLVAQSSSPAKLTHQPLNTLLNYTVKTFDGQGRLSGASNQVSCIICRSPNLCPSPTPTPGS